MAEPERPGLQTTRETFTTSDGVRLSYLRRGQPGGRLSILLVPGWSLPASVWSAQIDALGSSRTVFALDPRGQGESDIPDHGYDISTRARDLHEFAAAHAPVIVVGWSLAALETLQAIHLYGSAPFAGVVLVDSSVGEDPAPAPGTPFTDRLRVEREPALEDFMRAIFVNARPETELRGLVDGALRLPLEASLSLLPALIPREHWREIVRALDRPMLYAVTPQFSEQAFNLRQHRRRTRVEVFHRSGHALFADEPDRFNRLLVHFARSIRAD